MQLSIQSNLGIYISSACLKYGYAVLVCSTIESYVVIGTYSLQKRQLKKHQTLTQCWFNAGPASETMAQHWTRIESMPCVRGKVKAVKLWTNLEKRCWCLQCASGSWQTGYKGFKARPASTPHFPRSVTDQPMSTGYCITWCHIYGSTRWLAFTFSQWAQSIVSRDLHPWNSFKWTLFRLSRCIGCRLHLRHLTGSLFYISHQLNYHQI